jgi:DNA (cytosine-5)-methyltransferase 1
MNLELFAKPDFNISKKIRLIELFAGYGSQCMALERMGVDFESHYVCEFDKYAQSLYNAAHDTNFPTSDVTQIHAKDLNITETDKYTYLLTYSFPCTDISIAGKQAGMEKGSNTRSSLLWEVERLLTEIKETNNNLPQVLLMENVTQVHSKVNMQGFSSWIKFLTSLGYSSYYQDLNAKDFGIPQNRDRCFMVSLLGDYNFEFPNDIPLEYVWEDILEESVDEKYFINNEKAKNLINQLIIEKRIPEYEE